MKVSLKVASDGTRHDKHFLRRVQRDLQDSREEELELFDDLYDLDGLSHGSLDSFDERLARQCYCHSLFGLQAEPVKLWN